MAFTPMHVVVVPAKAGTHSHRDIERVRGMGPGSPSLRPVARDDSKKLSCFLALGRREALIEAFVVRGEIEQQLVGRKTGAVFLLQLAT